MHHGPRSYRRIRRRSRNSPIARLPGAWCPRPVADRGHAHGVHRHVHVRKIDRRRRARVRGDERSGDVRAVVVGDLSVRRVSLALIAKGERES